MGLPIFDILPSRSLPPLEWGFGVSPNQAAKSRPDLKAAGSGTNALVAAAVIAPTPGIVASRRMSASRLASATTYRSSFSIWRVSVSI